MKPELPSQWFDAARFVIRKEKGSGDQQAFLYFFQSLPGFDNDSRYEVCRMITSVSQMKEFVNMICRSLNHYPQDETKKAGED